MKWSLADVVELSIKSVTDNVLNDKLENILKDKSVQCIVKLLKKNGAKLDVPQKPQLAAIEEEEEENYDFQKWEISRAKISSDPTDIDTSSKILQLLFKYGWGSNFRTPIGENLLHLLVRRTRRYNTCMKDVIEILLESGVRMEEPDRHGFSPLLTAVSNENILLTQLLIFKGANVNQKSVPLGLFPIYVAVHRNNAKLVFDLFCSGANINAKIKSGWTALHLACFFNNEEMICLLIKLGADVTAICNDLRTPALYLDRNKKNFDRCVRIMLEETYKADFEKASSKSVESLLEMIFRCGWGSDFRSPRGDNLLHIFVRRVNYDDLHAACVTKSLANLKINIDDPNFCGYSPLLTSINTKNIPLIQTLVMKGANINQKSKRFGIFPLYRAVQCKNEVIAYYLLTNGANVNAKTKSGRTALHAACLSNSQEIIRALMKKGADITAVSKDGKPPAFLLNRNMKNFGRCVYVMLNEISKTDIALKDIDTFQQKLLLLIKRGFGSNYRSLHGKNLFHLFVRYVKRDDCYASHIAETLADLEVDINEQNSLGYSPLHASIRSGNESLIRSLIQKGADVNQKSKSLGKFPLYYAVQYNHENLLELFLNNGAEVNAKTNNGRTALIEACFSNNKEIVKTLVMNKADVNQRTECLGVFPLYIAVQSNNPNLVNFLLSNGAEINAQTNSGKTALHEACSLNNVEIIYTLIKKGADVKIKSKDGKSPADFLDRKKENYDRCSYLLVQEFSKLVCEHGMDGLSQNDLHFIAVDENARYFFNNCTQELIKMMETVFYGDYTYYFVLKMSNNVKKLSELLNEDFVKSFNVNLFSNYKNDLRFILNNAIAIKKSLEKEKKICDIF